MSARPNEAVINKVETASDKEDNSIKQYEYVVVESNLEPIEENTDCKELIGDVEGKVVKNERKRKMKEKRQRCGSKRKAGLSTPLYLSYPQVKVVVHNIDLIGIKDGIVDKENNHRFNTGPGEKIPEKIIGASKSGDQIMFLMKWQGYEEAEIIPETEANLIYPQIVIKFYKERLRYYQ